MHSLGINGRKRDDVAARPAAARVPRLSGVAAVSGHGTLLPLPDDPRFQALIVSWTTGTFPPMQYPRSGWLGYFERLLREFYPQSSSRDRSLTARHYAPFPLAAGHDVP